MCGICGTGGISKRLWNDIKSIRPLTKLLGQIFVVLVLFSYGIRIELLTIPILGGDIYIPLLLDKTT